MTFKRAARHRQTTNFDNQRMRFAVVLLFLCIATGAIYLVKAVPGISGLVQGSTTFISTIENIREGTLYVHSDGTDTLRINKKTDSLDIWTSEMLIKRPDGSVHKELSWGQTAPATTVDVPLNFPGDYQIDITQGMTLNTFSATSKLVVEPNARKRTFRDLRNGHARKLYFSVPAGKASITVKAEMNRSTAEIKIYRPNGAVATTDTVPTDAMNSKVYTFNSPEAGMWAVSMQSSVQLSEGTFWVEGVDNYFTDKATNYFVPAFTTANVAITANPGTIVSPRGLIGAGRVTDGNTPSAASVAAYREIKLEANETPISIKSREPQDDNLNLNNSGVQDTVNKLGATPIAFIGVIPDWMAKASPRYPAGCQSNYDLDTCIGDSEVHPELAESFRQILELYSKAGYPLKYVKLADEPNVDNVDKVGYAKALNAIGAELRKSTDPNVKNMRVYGGSFSMLNEDSKLYMKTIADVTDPQYLAGFAIHPWMMGYSGHGDIYSPRVMARDIDAIMDYAASKGGVNQTFVLPEVNARYGDHSVQDKVYQDSFQHALWWSSVIINLNNIGRAGAMIHYPWVEGGSSDQIIHNMRAMLYANYSIKPVGYVTKFILAHIKKDVFASTVVNSAEVEILGTKNANSKDLSLIAINKEVRTQNVSIDLNVGSLGISAGAIKLYRVTSANPSAPALVESVTKNAVSGKITYAFTMMPESVYAIDLVPTVTVPVQVCGNNVVETPELCDDGNTANMDKCSSDCMHACFGNDVWDGTQCVFQLNNQDLNYCLGNYDGQTTQDANKYKVSAADFAQFASLYKTGNLSATNLKYDLVRTQAEKTAGIAKLDINDLSFFAQNYKVVNDACNVTRAQQPYDLAF